MKKNYIYFAVLVIIIFVLIYFALNDNRPTKNISPDTESTQWNGYQKSEGINSIGLIAIPGIDMIVFKANEISQKVNIYNPSENDCLIRFTLMIDDDTYWQSGFCQAGDGYYEIELAKTLDVGIYSAVLLHECRKSDGTALNSAMMNLTIVAQ